MAVEAARAADFAQALSSIEAVVATAVHERRPSKASQPSAKSSSDFLNRGSSVINRALAQQKSLLFPSAHHTPSPTKPAPPQSRAPLGHGSVTVAALQPSAARSPRAGTRLTTRSPIGTTSPSTVIAGAGEMVVFPSRVIPAPPNLADRTSPVADRTSPVPMPTVPIPSLRADAVSEAAAIKAAGELRGVEPSVAISRLGAIGASEHVLLSSALPGDAYRRRFTQ